MSIQDQNWPVRRLAAALKVIRTAGISPSGVGSYYTGSDSLEQRLIAAGKSSAAQIVAGIGSWILSSDKPSDDEIETYARLILTT